MEAKGWAARSRALSSGFSTTKNSQGRRLRALGAIMAASSMASTSGLGMEAPGLNLRMLRRARMVWVQSIIISSCKIK